MKEMYYLITIIITGVASSLMTMYLPTLKRGFKRILLRFKRKSLNVSTNDLNVLIQRIEKLETKVNKRESNQRTFIRQEVKEYLINLQK